MKFQSEYADNADDLLKLKDDAYAGVKDRRDRLKKIRQFTNMMNVLTEEEADELGRTEITNHGLTHRSLLQVETGFTSMVTGTNALVEIIVDTDNAEKDHVTGMRITEAINRGAIHFKGKFANLWRKVSGELVMAGGGPVTNNERYGWLPKLRPDMFFPKETSLDAEEIPYAFDPKSLGVADLEKLKKAVRGESSSYIETENIEALLTSIRTNIRQQISGSSTFSEEESASVREQDRLSRKVTIPAWWFYEVKYKENGDQYVSATLFVDGSTASDVEAETRTKSQDSVAKIIAYIDKAFDNATDWLHMAVVDSEIGGVKNMDTLRGVAEMVYPSGVDMEELLNLVIEGEKIRAKPKIRLENEANADEVAKWNIMEDTYAPKGVTEMEFRGTSAGLASPLALLSQNASQLSTSSQSNSGQGGELRQQAVERQQNSAMLQTNRIAEASNHLDSILEMVVYRLLAAPTKPGTEGYREIMWVRAYLDQYGINYKELAKREWGRFKYIRVRAKRTIGNGDRQQQLSTADWLMGNLQNFEPIARPSVVHQATTLMTQDPDLADYLVKTPKAILNAQKVTAENEYDTIKRRAALGQAMPINQDDIHQDHIPVHITDMAAHVATHGMRPWDKLDVLVFAAAVEHTGEHLKVLLSNPLTHGEGAVFVQQYQQITQSAQRIVQEVEEASGSEQNQLTPKEQADMQLKWAALELEGRKFGLKVEDTQKLWENREARAVLSKRGQYSKEVNNDRRLELDKTRLRRETVAQINEADKPDNK